MLKNEVEIGGTYEVRWHDGRITQVKILGPKAYHTFGSRNGRNQRRTQYNAINLATGRMVVIKSAAKLRKRVA